ncbi:diacylglycerol O-acyltransferase 1 [Coelomomyces lativittatus]|nr:diacylglycerol O-acyltransferase 1 [Coelomomyces lativittatus]KAJ1506887.1 diacylglycerol O-acyltransferase 1 [Coelomomyces lativittatus]KAJ1510513.1 diacylglycerol O-acyltransferase 1 [Coelomomyces lativittatus]
MVQVTKGSFGDILQQKFKRMFGWTLPFFFGRGVFNYNLGVLPHRRRIVTIVASPVIPEHVLGQPILYSQWSPEKKEAMAHEIQRVYVQKLKEVWEKYKDVYAKDRIQELRIVE